MVLTVEMDLIRLAMDPEPHPRWARDLEINVGLGGASEVAAMMSRLSPLARTASGGFAGSVATPAVMLAAGVECSRPSAPGKSAVGAHHRT